MESLIPVTLASILTTLSSGNGVIEEAVIKTHVSPEISGLWELELQSTPDFAEQLSNSADIDSLDDKESAELQSLIKAIRESGELEKLQSVEPVDSDAVTSANQQNASVNDATQSGAIDSTDMPYKAANCRERYNFGADNVVLTTSGDEWTYGQYIYQHQAEGLPVIAINTTYDNNKTDCSGMKVDQTGDSILAFVDYQPEENKMRWCIDQDGKNCFMTFHKLLP